MKRLLLLVAGCLALGMAGLPVLVHGQRNRNDFNPPSRREIPRLITELKSDDAGKRARAANLIGQAGQVRAKDVAAAVPTLLTMAQKDADTNARRAAAQALGYSSPDPKTAVPILINILTDDKDYGVKTAAAMALGYLGPYAKSAIPALRSAMDIGKKAGKAERDKRNLGRAARDALSTIAPRRR